MRRDEGTDVTTRLDISSGPDDARDREIIQDISNWLIEQGLSGGEFEAILSGICERMATAGVTMQRAMIGMRTLHPSVDAKT